MIHATCDYCFRQFGYQADAPVVCLNCGLENIRPASPEAAELRRVPESAVLPRPGAVRRKPRKQV